MTSMLCRGQWYIRRTMSLHCLRTNRVFVPSLCVYQRRSPNVRKANGGGSMCSGAMNDKWCELCAAKGLIKKLRYCQLNFEEAMLLCENAMCVYPLGSTEVDSLLIKKPPHTGEKRKRRNSKIAEEKYIEKRVNISSNGLALHFYWSNADSLCWLDSAMTVLVNNRCLQLCLEKLQPKDSILQMLYNKFITAQRLGPVKKGKDLLSEARVEVFEFLKSKMQCELGKNDSPLVSLNLLLKENPQISGKFMQEYRWNFECTHCGYVQINRYKKCIVSFPNTTKDFSMPSGSFLRPCYQCQSPKQRSTLKFQQMPPCVLVHFVEGISNEEFLTSQFVFEGKEYNLCQLIQYKQDPDHFITWVRNTNGSHWGEVDDTKDIICKWHEGLPSVPVSQIHIAVWERTSLYQKILTSTKASDKTMIAHREQTKPQQALNGRLNQSNHLSSRPSESKEPHLSRRTNTQVKVQMPVFWANELVGDTHKNVMSACNSVKKLEKQNSVTGVLGSLVENRTNLVENSSIRKRTAVENFEPYIPRKKRNTATETAARNSNDVLVSEDDCSGSLSGAKEESVCDLNRAGNKSTNFVTRSDTTSVHLEEKQKQSVISDNQCDSGYSSPGSNSSCLSLTTPSTKQEPSMKEFLESLDTLDLPDIVNSSRCEPDTNNEHCGTSEKLEPEVVFNELFGEIFSEEEFQTKKSVTTIDRMINNAPDIAPSTCTLEPCNDGDMHGLDCAPDLDKLLADI